MAHIHQERIQEFWEYGLSPIHHPNIVDNRERVLRPGNHASNMMDVSRKTATATSQFDGIVWNKRNQKWQAQISFSNRHVKFQKHIGLFGVKGDKSTGQKEASQWREKVKENVERINELLKDITDLAVFKRKVNDEIKKIK